MATVCFIHIAKAFRRAVTCMPATHGQGRLQVRKLKYVVS